MTTYTWTISQLDRRISDGFVTTAHWQCTGVDGDLSSSVYATCSFDGYPVIPYENLTQETVLGWVWKQVDKKATEACVAISIEARVKPVIATSTPW